MISTFSKEELGLFPIIHPSEEGPTKKWDLDRSVLRMSRRKRSVYSRDYQLYEDGLAVD